MIGKMINLGAIVKTTHAQNTSCQNVSSIETLFASDKRSDDWYSRGRNGDRSGKNLVAELADAEMCGHRPSSWHRDRDGASPVGGIDTLEFDREVGDIACGQ